MASFHSSELYDECCGIYEGIYVSGKLGLLPEDTSLKFFIITLGN